MCAVPVSYTHLAGHRAILGRIADIARERGGESVVVTFDPHPRSVVGSAPVMLLNTLPEKLALLAGTGIDHAVVVDFTPEFSRLSMEEFVKRDLVAVSYTHLDVYKRQVITKEPRHKYEVTASLRYGTPYQRNGGDSLAGNASARDSREYRNKLDLPNLNADMTFGVNLGKFRSLTAVAYRTSDAYRLVGTRDEVRHYKELNIMRPKMNGSRPEMDPSTGMPVFVVGRTVADTTISVGPDSRGLSVSGWRDLNLSQRFDYELSDQFRFQLSGSYFRCV